ncbi:MAG: hypothetical protein QN123_14375 [Armatimonadota bacterium]|nr:hypothetical protein [Armatimonadota bacterium]MDR7520738.1 hypothetical protein [Armatimonadota bacterium]
MGARVALRSFWARQWKGLRRFWHEVGRRIPERLWLLWVVATLIFSPDWWSARYAVRKVAREPGFSGERGLEYLRQAVLYPGAFENIFRNQEASLWMRLHAAERGRRIRGWRRELLVELAYLALRERGR